MSSNYKSIAKANALFGGVQIYIILVGIIRSKLIAVLLGVEGMGIMGLLNSTIDLVKTATNCGLQTSAVRDVSLAKSSENKEKVSTVYTIISKLVWITGILGSLIVFLFAEQLSYITFSNGDYIWSFRILSIVLLLAQLTVVNQVMLQGLRALKRLALNNVVGNTLGLFLVIPLYYYYGYNGIVPSIIVAYLVGFIVSTYYMRKLRLSKVSMSYKEAFVQGKQMIILGFMLSLTGLMDVTQTYLVKIFVAQVGSVVDVGLYNAGFSIIVGYVGLVFSSIGTDYFPRLSSVSNDPSQYNDVINDQMEIMLLVLLPLVCFFIPFSELAIKILYTDEFLGVKMMINIMAIAMIQRAISWCPGYLYVAKGDSRLYLIIYIITFVISTAMYLVFYYLWGLTGIGVAFFLIYFLGNFTTFWITNHFYHYKLRRQTFIIMLVSFVLSGFVWLCSFYDHFVSLIITIAVLLATLCYSYIELNSRLDITNIIRNKIRK